MDTVITPQLSIKSLITQILEGASLDKFKGIARVKFPEVMALQPFYNRLYVIDMHKTLKANLPQLNTELTFIKAVANIWNQQQDEINYLTLHHPKLKSMIGPLSSGFPTLKILEARHAALDEINKHIIINETRENNGFIIDLSAIYLTRFSTQFFNDTLYADILKNCPSIDLVGNRITMLDLRACKRLKHVWCDNNRLITVNVQGLDELEIFTCSSNLISVLSVRDCSSLKKFDFKGNPLTELTLVGTPSSIREQFGEIETELLCQKFALTTITKPMELDIENQITPYCVTKNIEEPEEVDIETEEAPVILNPAPQYVPMFAFGDATAPTQIQSQVQNKRKRVPDDQGPQNKRPKN